MTGTAIADQQPRIEDFRSDLSPEQIGAVGAFNVALRTYQPQTAIVDGRWFPPAIVHVS